SSSERTTIGRARGDAGNRHPLALRPALAWPVLGGPYSAETRVRRPRCRRSARSARRTTVGQSRGFGSGWPRRGPCRIGGVGEAFRRSDGSTWQSSFSGSNGDHAKLGAPGANRFVLGPSSAFFLVRLSRT